MMETNRRQMHKGIGMELIFVNDFPEEEVVLPENVTEKADFVIVIENQINVGIHQSRINGLAAASGEWIVFLDQDDTIADTYFVSQFTKAEGYDAVVSNGYWRGGEKIYTETYPFANPCTFDMLTEYGYPLISLGQLMVKRERISSFWVRKALKHNGCDDLYLWALMMAENVKVAINDDFIYTHEENGDNASLNYKEMKLSIENVKRDFLNLNCVSSERKKRFEDMMDRISLKYSQYDSLNEVFGNIDPEKIERYFLHRNIKKVAVYGVGIYGKALLRKLRDTSIVVCYGIDMRADVKDVGIPVVNPDSELGAVDAVIVTPVAEFEGIREMLKRKGFGIGQILCLNEIL